MGSNPIRIDRYDIIPGSFESEYLEQERAYYLFRGDNSIIYAFFMYIMRIIITFIEKIKGRDQNPLSLNPVQKANDPFQDRCRRIGPISQNLSNVLNFATLFNKLFKKRYNFRLSLCYQDLSTN